jgi:hypothetical protein
MALAACATETGTTTTSVPTTTTTVPVDDARVLPVADDLGPDWTLAFHIPYGHTPDTLGVSLGGDGEGLLIGPDYGAQAADGSWWFLDGAKLRLAHFSESGDYLGEVAVPESLLVNLIYFQFELPRILDDGTLVATAVRDGMTEVLRLRDGVIDSIYMDREWIPRTHDGVLLYGFLWDGPPIEVDLANETVTEVDWFRTRTGARYRVTPGPGTLRIELPDTSPPVDRELSVVTPAAVGGRVFMSLEVVSTADGVLHLFILGFSDADDRVQLGGYLTIAPDGAVGPMEPVRNPFTEADTGSPSRLGVRPGTNEVSLMFIDTDGVRVFTRSG